MEVSLPQTISGRTPIQRPSFLFCLWKIDPQDSLGVKEDYTEISSLKQIFDQFFCFDSPPRAVLEVTDGSNF